MFEFKFSVVIPTRNRHETAIHAVKSCINTKYPKLEIIVQDNSDGDELYRLLVISNLIGKVVYNKVKTILPMHLNWEEGVALSTGDYICVLGDDDGLFPDSLIIANSILVPTSAEILRTRAAIYKWPNYPYPAMSNYLFVPLGTDIIRNNDPKSLLRKSLSYEIDMGTGPGIYHGFIQRKLIEKIKYIRGKYFIDHMPDFDSGYSVLMYSKEIITIERPLVMSGHSGKSNSGGMRSNTLTNIAVSKYNRELSSDQNQIDKEIFFEGIDSVPSAIVASQFRLLPELKKVLHDDTLNISIPGALIYIAKQINQSYDKFSYNRLVNQTIQAALKYDCIELVKKNILPYSSVMDLKTFKGFKVRESEDSNGKKIRSESIIINCQNLFISEINQSINLASSLLSSLYKQSGDPKSETYKYYQAFESLGRDDLLQSAYKNIDELNFNVAELILKELASKDGNDFDAYYQLGRVRSLMGNYVDSILPLERALSLKMAYEVAEVYIECLTKIGLNSTAIQFLDSISSYATNESRKIIFDRMKLIINNSVNK